VRKRTDTRLREMVTNYQGSTFVSPASTRGEPESTSRGAERVEKVGEDKRVL